MKKFIVLLLTMCMLLCILLTGCGKKSEIEGFWHAEIDLTDFVNESIENNGLGEYVKISYFGFDYFAYFNDDGTYEFNFDTDGAASMYEQAREDFKKGVTEYFEAMIEKNNANITVEELLESQGKSLDALLEEEFPDDKLQSFMDSMSHEGNYESKEGKLYLSDGLDYRPSKEVFEEYTLDGTTLTITAGNTKQSSEFDIFPLVFEKLG